MPVDHTKHQHTEYTYEKYERIRSLLRRAWIGFGIMAGALAVDMAAIFSGNNEIATLAFGGVVTGVVTVNYHVWKVARLLRKETAQPANKI